MTGWTTARCSGAAALLVAVQLAVVSPRAESFQLPPEVTPTLRSACESDVRRLCVDASPTLEKVKACIQRRFGELGSRCKLAIAASGLTPRTRPRIETSGASAARSERKSPDANSEAGGLVIH